MKPTFNNVTEKLIYLWYSSFPPSKEYTKVGNVWIYKNKWWHKPWFLWFFKIKNWLSYMREMIKMYINDNFTK